MVWETRVGTASSSIRIVVGCMSHHLRDDETGTKERAARIFTSRGTAVSFGNGIFGSHLGSQILEENDGKRQICVGQQIVNADKQVIYRWRILPFGRVHVGIQNGNHQQQKDSSTPERKDQIHQLAKGPCCCVNRPGSSHPC